MLRITVTNKQYPYLYVVFDGTDSMAIADELPAKPRTVEVEIGFDTAVPGGDERGERAQQDELVRG